MTSTPLTKTSLFQYGILALPLAFAGLPLYIYAPDLYTRDLGLSITIMGAVLLFIRLFDAFQDPIIGRLSDRFSRYRTHIILFGIALLSVGLIGTFLGPQLSIPIAAWFGIFVLLATTGFSIATINLNMIGGFWSDNIQERTRISAWREGLGLIGILIASLLPAILLQTIDYERAFNVFLVVFIVLCGIATFFFLHFIKTSPFEHLKINTKKSETSIFSILFGENRLFFGVFFMAQLASALPAVLILFFINDYLNLEAYTGLFLSLYLLSGIALIGVWVKISYRIGKYETWLASMLLSVLCFIWVIFIQPGDIISYSIVCILSGFVLGADLSIPPSIIADRITRQKQQSNATLYFGVMALLPKLSLAIASGGAFLILGEMGFLAGGNNSSKASMSLLLLYGLVPCLIKVLGAGLLWKLLKKTGDINHDTHNERNSNYGTSNVY